MAIEQNRRPRELIHQLLEYEEALRLLGRAFKFPIFMKRHTLLGRPGSSRTPTAFRKIKNIH